MVVEVRRAAPADVAAIHALEQEFFGVDAWSRASLEQELFGDGRRSLVAVDAVDAERVLGYALTWTTGEVTDLQRVVVAPAARRRGVGRRLVRRLVDEAARHGALRLLLEVSAANDAALACYRALGLAEIDRRPAYYGDGSDALVLQLDLTASRTEECP
jgi:[ribosomal protein S18]-alanine N-acetyltransferase